MYPKYFVGPLGTVSLALRPNDENYFKNCGWVEVPGPTHTAPQAPTPQKVVVPYGWLPPGRILQVTWDPATEVYSGDSIPEVPEMTQPKPKDSEEELRAKILKPFAGEAGCPISEHNKKLTDAPILPWFGKGEDAASHESRRKMKRWVSTNLREWPLCSHSRQPLDLVFDGSYLPDGHGGQFCDPGFFCQYCDGKRIAR